MRRSTSDFASLLGITPPTDIDLTLPRIYLDANVLIDALLTEKKPLERDRKAMKEEAKKLWENWRGPAIKVSPHSIAEFIAVGKSDEYRYNFKYLLGVIKNDIAPPKCEFIHAELGDDKETLDNINAFHKWLFASFKIEGEAILNGMPIGLREVEMGFDVKYNLWRRGFPLNPDDKLLFTNVTSGKFVAPYFEFELFKKASEIAIDKKIPLGDALHFMGVRLSYPWIHQSLSVDVRITSLANPNII